LGAGAADHAIDGVALIEQQLGQVAAVLAGDAGDEGGFRSHACPQDRIAPGRSLRTLFACSRREKTRRRLGLHKVGWMVSGAGRAVPGRRYITPYLTKSRRPSSGQFLAL